MKKIMILLIALATSTLAFGQEEKTEQIKEIGLTFRNLDNFGFSYKVGTAHSLWRFNAISIAGYSESQNIDDKDNDRDSNHFGLGFSVGKEYRKHIAENFEYRYGFDFSFGYNHSKITQPSYSQNYSSSTATSNFFTPGFNLVFGVNYIISDHLVLGAEIMPFFKYTFGETSQEMEEYYDEIETDHSNFRYGFDSSSVLLSLAYRF